MAYLEAVARNKGVPEPFVDDCAQEMRLALWRAGRDFEDPRHFNALDRTIAIREAIDFRRCLNGVTTVGGQRISREGAVTFSAIDAALPLGFGVGDLFLGQDSERDFDAEEAISRLSERDQRLLLLDAYGWNLMEIGKREGISNTRVCQLLKRARAQLARP